MCKKHYKAWDYLRPPANDSERCVVDGCPRRAHLKKTQMCHPHHSTCYRQGQAAKGVKRNRGVFKRIICAYESCGQEHWVEPYSPTQFCSLTCAQRSMHTKSQDLVIYTGPPFVRKPKINKNPIPKRVGKFKSGSCKVCNYWFLSLFGDATCSAECQALWKKTNPAAIENKRMAEDRRRARKRDAFVAPVWRKKVFAADAYRCYLCNRKCKEQFIYLRNSQVPHPLSPTLDHVIPLAKGGTHEPGNCRTACFKCNTEKSDRGGGEQFALTLTG
jgi:5-methylcytosine-specific restriction endonuclease McrA